MNPWEELLVWIAMQGGAASRDDDGTWWITLAEDEPVTSVFAVTREPQTLNEFVQLLAALTQAGLVWPPPWRGELN